MISSSGVVVIILVVASIDSIVVCSIHGYTVLYTTTPHPTLNNNTLLCTTHTIQHSTIHYTTVHTTVHIYNI